MDSRTGEVYPSREAALSADVPESALVEIFGSQPAVDRTAQAVRKLFELEQARLDAQIRQRRHHSGDHPPKGGQGTQ